jgi:hypothetical protein
VEIKVKYFLRFLQNVELDSDSTVRTTVRTASFC